MDVKAIINPALLKIEAALKAQNYKVWLVGGCVRDLLSGIEPKDVDLCTDATPNQMIDAFKAAGIRYAETGLHHGTISAIIDKVAYEITTLRTETDHDGRHAVVSYVTDLETDLARRDLTINAMAMTFDGVLIDPFGGQRDLANRVVRFVGNPIDRMREDYLRILRWLRFHARIASDQPLDPESAFAARKCAEGLSGISRERVWTEMAKIISGPAGTVMIEELYRLGLNDHIGLPPAVYDQKDGRKHPFVGEEQFLVLVRAAKITKNPVTLMVALLGDAAASMPTAWKWSTEERDLCKFLVANMRRAPDWRAMLAIQRKPKAWLLELAALDSNYAAHHAIAEWVVPTFPVTGDDLLARGLKQGPELGKIMRDMKERWRLSDYTASKEDLLA